MLMTYYVREIQDGFEKSVQIWNITENEAIRLGTDRGGIWHYVREKDEEIWDTIRRCGAWSDKNQPLPIKELKVQPGYFYPRIARPIIAQSNISSRPINWQPTLIGNDDIVASARLQLSTLVRQLSRICETVQTDEKNLDVYGYDIRNLLILACTEVENHWKGVLKANGVHKDRYMTTDYVRLLPVLKLNAFKVSFPDFPWMEAIKPFSGWNSCYPTKSIEWYDAYNQTKHSREDCLSKATLRFVFHAVAGCAVMIIAQFGEVFGYDLQTAGRPRTFFWLQEGPEWEASEYYAENTERHNGGKWNLIKCPLELQSMP